VTQEIADWMLEWFRSRGKQISGAQEALRVDYLQSGLLTSLEIVELVASIEDHFGVQFSEADMQDPRFLTIGGLSELVGAALNRDNLEPRTLESESPKSNGQNRVG